MAVEEPYARIVGFVTNDSITFWGNNPCITSHWKCGHAGGGIAEAQRRGIGVSVHDTRGKEIVLVDNSARSAVRAVSAGN